jgi:hypothetical protein
VQAILTKPVVGLHRGRQRIATLPSGAVIELHDHADKVGLVDVEWNGQCFSVFCEDLLDACTVHDVVRVSFI